MAKSLEDSFIDWESHVFGFGYGTGEDHVLVALKTFLGLCGEGDSQRQYDYRHLEAALGPVVAWLLINTLCHAGILDYGVSPRHGWLSETGERLKEFVDSRSVEELVDLTHRDHDYDRCMPDVCNCGPNGYEKGRVCQNPFWGQERR